MMKITTLIENRVSRAGLVAEHGLSFYIEAGKKKLIFDTGAGENFAQNAKVMGINLSKADLLILSHGHNDHTGGLSWFIENNNKASVYLKEETLWPKYKFDRSIGMSNRINTNNSRFRMIREINEVVEGIFIFPVTHRYFEIDQHKAGFFTNNGEEIVADAFLDELFLVMKNNGGISILSSCSHNGITNMVETAANYFKLPVRNVIGGFHLKNSTREVSNHIADYFNQKKVEKVYTGHCTGIENFIQIQTNCNAKVFYLETGDKIEIE